MIQSMTGYGKAVVAFGDKKINVEVKSLNSKTLDLSTRICPLYREKEIEIRQAIAKTLERGKVDFAIWTEKNAASDATPINKELMKAYYKQICDIVATTGIPQPQDIFATILRMPDVMTRTEIEELTDEEFTTVEGRKLYFKYTPRRGWRRFVPLSFQYPPEPVDDFVAWIIGRRYLAKQRGGNP